jgi:hypothetical protein
MTDSKAIASWHDLEEYGIDVLTGEACGIGIRVLCQVDPSGKELLDSFLGVQIEMSGLWNSAGSTPEAPIGSLMLPRRLYKDIAIYALLRDGYHVAVERAHVVRAYSKKAWHEEFHSIHRKASWANECVLYFRSTGPGDGLRNRHMFTGRMR